MTGEAFKADPVKQTYLRLNEIEKELVEARRFFTKALASVRRLQDDIRPMIVEDGQ
jgi:phage shock protein A